jgi:endonuclease IV
MNTMMFVLNQCHMLAAGVDLASEEEFYQNSARPESTGL